MGFRLKYQSTDEAPQVVYRMGELGECGGTYTFPYGLITSPSYPRKYPINADCVYNISQPNGTVILLNFLTMDIESGSSCNYDYLLIKDGPSEDSPLLDRLCDKKIPDPIQSTNNTIWMK